MAKILLVEDNDMSRDMLSRRLERRGFVVVTAATGVEAVEKARSEGPSLILMDLSLPDVDGWEATRQIKGAPETAAIPIIALTAHAMAGDREQALAAGEKILSAVQAYFLAAGESDILENPEE